jgi:Holliday junction resolvase
MIHAKRGAPGEGTPSIGDGSLGGRTGVILDQSPSKLQASRGGRRSRDKGNRLERELVNLLQRAGITAERIPLSGSAGGKFAGDISIPVLGVDRCGECKVRGKGFGQLYTWLRDRDLLIIRADRRELLVVVPLKLAIEIAVSAERGRR